MDELLSVLLRLSACGHTDNDQNPEDASAGLTEADVEAARACCNVLEQEDDKTCQEEWQRAAETGVSFLSVANALNAQMRSTDQGAATIAALFYSTVLRSNAAPVSSLFTALVFSSFLQVCKRCACPTSDARKPEAPKKRAAAGGKGQGRGKRKQTQDMSESEGDDGAVSDGSDDAQPRAARPTQRQRRAPAAAAAVSTADPAAAAAALLSDVLVFLQSCALAQSQELLTMLLDALTDVTVGAAPAIGASSSRARNNTGSPADVAYSIFTCLLDTRHGPVAATGTLICMRLLPTLLGAASAAVAAPAGGGGRRPGAQDGAARRNAALTFITSSYREHSDLEPAVTALVRQLCMRALDKADARAAAVAAAHQLLASLPASQQQRLCTWLLLLSRSAKPTQRLVSVDLAHTLLTSLSQPWGPQAGYKAFMDGSHGPGDEIDAPWSAVLLTLLVQRCDDKVAGIRARAVSHLSEVLSQALALLKHTTGHDQDASDTEQDNDTTTQNNTAAPRIPPAAEGFLLALCGTNALTLDAVAAAAAAPAPAPRPAAKAANRKGAGGAGKKGGGRGAAAARRRRGRGDSSDLSESEGEGEGEEGGEDGAQQGPGGLQAGDVCVWAGPGYRAVLPSRIRLNTQPLTELAHRRLQDDKAPVRKAALALLEASMLLRAGLPAPVGGPPNARDVTAVEVATTDALVSVRKAALVAASRLVTEFPRDLGCCELWVRAALPLVRDVEGSIQEAVQEQVLALMLQPLQTAASAATNTAAGAVRRVRPLLGALALAGRGAAACVGKACAALLAKKSAQGKRVATGLEATIRTLQVQLGSTGTTSEEIRMIRYQLQGAWMLLREVSACDASAASWQFLNSAWTSLQSQGQSASGEEGALLLWVIRNSADRFPASDANTLAKDLAQALSAFTLPPAAAAAHISALAKLSSTDSGAGTSKGNKANNSNAWSAKLLEGAHDVLTRFLDKTKKSKKDDHSVWRVSAALFALGEIALLGVKIPAAIVIKVQSLTSPELTQSLTQPTTAPSTQPATQAGAEDAPPEQTQAADGAEGAAGAAGGDAAAARAAGDVCGVAWACLGKLCMADESLAKKAVPLFVQEITRSPYPVVRNNCLVALADMCIQYTALVDSYLPRLANLIRDPHELVRRQALALLANLLMKDYVKWRGALFHRFALALVDPSPAVRHLAEHLMGHTLVTKAPNVVNNHFIESLFVLNACTAGLHANRVGCGGGGGEGPTQGAGATQGDAALAAAREACGLFNLRGDSYDMRSKRDVVYHTFLLRMTPEGKFGISAKLVSEILNPVADGLLVLSDPAVSEVLGDALRLLGSKQIKVSSAKVMASEEDAIMAAAGADGTAGATQELAAAAHVKGKIVSELLRKHVVEEMVPVMCELRHLLQDLRHPMLSSLMQCMASVLKDYKNDLESILAVDKQLAKEIVHDLKQAELQAKQQQATQVANQAAEQARPAHRGPVAAGQTPLAAEVLASGGARTAARIAGAGRRVSMQGLEQAAGPSSQPTTPGAALRAGAGAAGAATPGAALLRSARSPHSLGAARTPGTGLRHPASAGGAAGGGLTPAPVSAARAADAARKTAAAEAKRNQRRVVIASDEEEDDDTDQATVALPDIATASQPLQERPWNVQPPTDKPTKSKRNSNKPSSAPTQQAEPASQQPAAENTRAGGSGKANGGRSKTGGQAKGSKGSQASGVSGSQADGAENVAPSEAGGGRRKRALRG